MGRRISKTVRHTNGTATTTHYGWDGDRIVREETDDQRTTVVYEPGSFVPMLRIDDTQQGQTLSAYITDALGTPMQLVTPNGQPRWLADPDDWAAVKKQRAVRHLTQPIRFQGQWHDEESGLYYNRHRYYDPQQGRYISQDPIGLRGGTNLYGYVTNPTGMVDPLGLFDRPGPIDQSGRKGTGRSNPYSRFPPAPRSTLEKTGNTGLSKVWEKVTGGFSKIDPATARVMPNPKGAWGLLFHWEGMAKCQSLYCDLDGDGLSDSHYGIGICRPGSN
ncbi:RHS repeat-associated core domain-containing protein [Halomonas llamarensis]|uniref:RHS protein conserved region domain-containing protein n=1 Tax=Halomonas llamarensis TaxID=2945104 RepID=A0ABT0SSU9_9GAMM|nr:RHS repeat-associated core domain-containing protein [Halomonas llamarensis]MCL7930673.1 hypothetical protein [Halomonas llamarensis]